MIDPNTIENAENVNINEEEEARSLGRQKVLNMEKDTMITLEDGATYVLLDETVIEGKKYFFAVKH